MDEEGDRKKTLLSSGEIRELHPRKGGVSDYARWESGQELPRGIVVHQER